MFLRTIFQFLYKFFITIKNLFVSVDIIDNREKPVINPRIWELLVNSKKINAEKSFDSYIDALSVLIYNHRYEILAVISIGVVLFGIYYFGGSFKFGGDDNDDSPPPLLKIIRTLRSYAEHEKLPAEYALIDVPSIRSTFRGCDCDKILAIYQEFKATGKFNFFAACMAIEEGIAIFGENNNFALVVEQE